jgi:V/A-type H+-transporting ATPase subunit F
MDIAVIGSDEFVLGFRLAGLKRVYTTTEADLERRILELLADSSIGVLVMNSSDLDGLGAIARKKVLDSIAPVVVPVGKGEGDLREKVKRAIGVDLYKTERG